MTMFEFFRKLLNPKRVLDGVGAAYAPVTKLLRAALSRCKQPLTVGMH
jgi:hypothetical protein